MKKGKLILIPTPISEDLSRNTSDLVKAILSSVTHIVAERARTTRRHIKAILPTAHIPDYHILEYDKHDTTAHIAPALAWLSKGYDVGFMSEAGCPAIADPGCQLVREAHKIGCEVDPLVGPSSIFLALMASGLNGQSFRFLGYLPNKKPELLQALKRLESPLQQGETQIFIETPYRNKPLFEELLKHFAGRVSLCIATNVLGRQQHIQTKTITEWKSSKMPDLHKQVTVFLLGK